MAQAATHPTAAVFGSPANSLGSALSQFLSHRTKHPSRKSKTPPKPQRKRHCRLRFLILRQLSPSGLGHTRSRLARTASANRFVSRPAGQAVPHSTFLQPLSQRWLKAVLPSHSSILSAGCNQRRKEGKPIFTITLHPIENRHLNHFGQVKARRPTPRKAKPFGF